MLVFSFSNICRCKLFVFFSVPLLISFSKTLCADEQSWLGDETKGGFFGLRLGRLDDESTSTSLSTTLPLFSFSQLHLAYSDTKIESNSPAQNLEGENQNSKSWSTAWNSDTLSNYSFGFGYDKNGLGSDVEYNNSHLQLQANIGHYWSIRGRYVQGDIDLKLPAISSEAESRFRGGSLLSRERRGASLHLNYDSISWGMHASIDYFDYDEDSVILPEESGQLIESVEQLGEEETQYVRILFAKTIDGFRAEGFGDELARQLAGLEFSRNWQEIKRGAIEWVRFRAMQIRNAGLAYGRSIYGQQSVLSTYELALDGYFTMGNTSLLFGALTYQSYVEETQTYQLFGGVDYLIGEHLSVAGLVSYSEEDSDTPSASYIEMSIGYAW